jgi:ribosome biogenesis GTPase A
MSVVPTRGAEPSCSRACAPPPPPPRLGRPAARATPRARRGAALVLAAGRGSGGGGRNTGGSFSLQQQPRTGGGKGGGTSDAPGGASEYGGGAPSSKKRSNRGRALLQGPLRPGEADDPALVATVNELAAREGVEAVALVQWYPGHIARAERALRERLAGVDVVIEVRDGRAPMASRHPRVGEWTRGRPRVLVLNRRDMVPDAAAAAWGAHFRARGAAPLWTNANRGDGVERVAAAALAVSGGLNAARARRGLRPRAVRAAVVGLPNVGKSALINRLLGRRVADSAPRPGVTRDRRWARVGGDLDLLDAPGVIPPALRDQAAAARLAMCNDIGEAAYLASAVAAALLATLRALPDGDAALARVEARYKLPWRRGATEEEYIAELAERMFNAETERAGQRLLRDFRSLALGRACLEAPDAYAHYEEA